MYELVATGNDVSAAHDAAQATGGVAYAANPNDDRPYVFRTLVRAVTDNPEALTAAAEVGLYAVFARVIRTRPEQPSGSSAQSPQDSPGVTAIFPLIHHPDLTHTQSDQHWRDTHAPLALQHHPGMWDYTQLSVVANLAGPIYDGFAMVAFESLTDMKERFFGDDNDRAVIYADVAKFADTERSPRRVVATEHVYGERPPVAEVNWPSG